MVGSGKRPSRSPFSTTIGLRNDLAKADASSAATNFQLPRPISFANSPTLSVLDREPRGPGFPPIIDIFEGNGEGAESVQQRLPLCHLQHSHCPPHCKRLEIPTLQVEAVCNVFYCTYGDVDRSGTVDDLLQRLDFHALSITLLTTTAFSNIWNYDRLVKAWD